jgi:segregation and condensation protein B
MIEPVTADAVDVDRLVEALLFMSPTPVPEAEIQRRLPEGVAVGMVLARLGEHYARRGLSLVQVAGGWTFRTAADLAPALRPVAPEPRRLSRAALEVLAVIAYHQPVTRGDIEDIRGVALAKGTLDTLLEVGWIRPRGRRQSVGRPRLWITTAAFLTHFQLDSLDDLPAIEDLRAAGLLDTQPTAIAMREREAQSALSLPEATRPARQTVDAD